MTYGSNYSNTVCQLLLCVAEVEARRMAIRYVEKGHDGDSVWSQSRDCRLINTHEVGGKDLVARCGS